MGKWSWYVWLPADLLVMAAVFALLHLRAASWAWVAGLAALVALYSTLVVAGYAQTSNKWLLVGNIGNLAIFAMLNRFVLADVWSSAPGEYFCIFFSTPNLIVIWFVLLLWQCAVRYFVWLCK